MWIMSSIVSSQYHHIIWLRRCAISCLLICAFPDEILYTMMLLIALYKIENKKCFCGRYQYGKRVRLFGCSSSLVFGHGYMVLKLSTIVTSIWGFGVLPMLTQVHIVHANAASD